MDSFFKWLRFLFFMLVAPVSACETCTDAAVAGGVAAGKEIVNRSTPDAGQKDAGNDG